MSQFKLLLTNSVLLSLPRGLCNLQIPSTPSIASHTHRVYEIKTCSRAEILCRNFKRFCTTRARMAEPSTSGSTCQSEASDQLFKDISDDDWKFSSSDFLNFPLDPVKENYIRRNVLNSIFSVVNPTPLKGQTFLAGVSSGALELLDLHSSVSSSSQFRDFVSGAWIHPSSTPVAHRYGGHQFGWWAEQLGDGRAHLLGHYTNRNGSWWELQLKGSGKTPYSRFGDGRAVIRSSVREFLAAEAMEALGFRTSRSATLVVGDEMATRDQFYNGKVKLEKTAVVLRLAPTWFRFGSLEILTRRQEIDLLKMLVDYIIEKHFKSLSVTDPDRYLGMFSQILEETAEMIAQWQSVGFAHGVMNTDNMSIVSVTIDYGPFGFLDVYDPDFIPNASDDDGMYSYRNQPDVAYVNLRRLAEALQPLLTPNQIRQMRDILFGYKNSFQRAYLKLFTRKLGLQNVKVEEDEDLVKTLLEIMEDSEADFTMTFWELGNISIEKLKNKDLPKEFWGVSKCVNHENFNSFIDQYESRLKEEDITEDIRQSIMATSNPRYILRNWIAQQVIEKVEYGSYNELNEALNILQNPFTIQPGAEKKGYAKPPPKWACKLKVSCSS